MKNSDYLVYVTYSDGREVDLGQGFRRRMNCRYNSRPVNNVNNQFVCVKKLDRSDFFKNRF